MNKYGKLISEIPEEDEESGSFECVDSDEDNIENSDDEDEESK